MEKTNETIMNEEMLPHPNHLNVSRKPPQPVNPLQFVQKFIHIRNEWIGNNIIVVARWYGTARISFALANIAFVGYWHFRMLLKWLHKKRIEEWCKIVRHSTLFSSYEALKLSAITSCRLNNTDERLSHSDKLFSMCATTVKRTGDKSYETLCTHAHDVRDCFCKSISVITTDYLLEQTHFKFIMGCLCHIYMVVVTLVWRLNGLDNVCCIFNDGTNIFTRIKERQRNDMLDERVAMTVSIFLSLFLFYWLLFGVVLVQSC